jgi:hypothetical protein
MRHSILILILFPVVAFAQGNPNMPPNMPMDMEQMQRNMQQMDMGKMQEAMACMKDIDQSALKGLEEEGKKMKAEVEAMCKSGNRDGAQDKAMEYGKEIMNQPEMKKMRKCRKMMAGIMPKMPFENFEEEGKNRHICDEFKPVD